VLHADGGKLLLSTGLRARVVAKSGEVVAYGDGTSSSDRPFHYLPGGGTCFGHRTDESANGWVYVSNSGEPDDGGSVQSRLMKMGKW